MTIQCPCGGLFVSCPQCCGEGQLDDPRIISQTDDEPQDLSTRAVDDLGTGETMDWLGDCEARFERRAKWLDDGR